MSLLVGLLIVGAFAVTPIAYAADAADANASVATPISADGLWRAAPNLKATDLGRGVAKISRYRTYRLDAALLQATLERAKAGEAGTPQRRVQISLPMPDGSYARFDVYEAPLFAPDVQARFPDIHTYRGQGVDDPSATASIELSPFGLRAYVLADDETIVVDPAGDGKHYLSYWKKNATSEPFACSIHDAEASIAEIVTGRPKTKAHPNGGTLRTYRFAATLTGEYTTFFGGLSCPAGSPATCPQSAAAAALATTMNRVRGLFERDVDVSFNIVATNIYADPATDPFTNGSSVDATLLNENQADVDAVTGAANYDIGHIFSQGGSGGSAPGRACSATKARGGTSRNNPSGDPYDVDFVAHEVGHQLSASHTWSGSNMSCTAAQFTATSAYEPGSGSTIMGYAGICAADNVQSNSDAYFHQRSIDQITDFRNDAGTGGSCGTLANTGNTPPTVNAGTDYTIPRSTPFVLTASGNDANGDAITFTWEQYDTGAQVNGVPPATQAAGPLFRSFAPTASTSRTLPTLASLLGGAASPWEVLPAADRALNFRVTVRDNRAAGGGTDFDGMIVNVSGAPFSVTGPASGSNLQCGMSDTLTWQVGGGSVAPTVRADISTNNGASFSTLIGSTPNDGSDGFAVPRTLTADGRIRLAAIGNIFFNLSPKFGIVDTVAPSVTAPPAIMLECTGLLTPVSLGLATGSDACDASPAISSNAPATFSVGTTIVTWSARDASNNVATATQLVTVKDTTPPSLTLSVSPESMWPPNHHLHRIAASLAASDVCDPNPQIRLLAITSDEPDNGTGDGNTIADIQEAAFGTDDRDFLLRAERSGNRDGRVYTITYEARDASGNATVRTARVTVAHNQ
ncbi:MAG: reprolysin-like metallopeptidase [Casimicrobiaceae bacterium]